MRWLVAAASVIAFALATALVIRTVKKSQPITAAPPASAAAPIPVGCPDRELRPGPVLPDAAAAPLQLVVAPGVQLLIDGAEPGPNLLEGVHEISATSAGQKPAKLKIDVEAFTPVLLDVRSSFGAVTVLLEGARCASCAPAVAEVNLEHDAKSAGDLSRVAKALADGDWVEGARVMREIPPLTREAPEAKRLLAVLYTFIGRPTLARQTMDALADPSLTLALTRRDALEELKPVRQLQTATARWNALTERFQRMTDRFVADAPKPVSSLTMKFGDLSRAFASAQEKQDAIGCEAALESANTALNEVIMGLRAMRSEDCAWQRRVTEAL